MKTILGAVWTSYLAPLVFLGVAAGFLVLTYQLPPAARDMPVLVGWATLVLALVDLVSRTGGELGRTLMRALNPSGLKPSAEAKAEAPSGRFAVISGIGLVVLLIVAFILTGVLIAAPLVIFTALVIADRREIVLSAVIAAVTTLSIWLVFSLLLRLHLYPGFLFGSAL